MNEDIKVGDVVILNSGSPTMTVTYTWRDNIDCAWFDGDILRESTFMRACVAIQAAA